MLVPADASVFPAASTWICRCCQSMSSACKHASARSNGISTSANAAQTPVSPGCPERIFRFQIYINNPGYERLPVNLSHGHLVTWSSRHTVMSSHGQPVTGQLITRVSSQSQLVTSEHITKPPVLIFYLHAGQVAPRNSAQHGRRNYGKQAHNKTYAMPCSSVWLSGFNVTVS